MFLTSLIIPALFHQAFYQAVYFFTTTVLFHRELLYLQAPGARQAQEEGAWQAWSAQREA